MTDQTARRSLRSLPGPPQLRAGGWGSGGTGSAKAISAEGRPGSFSPVERGLEGAGEVRALAEGKSSATRLGLELKERSCDLPAGEERRGICSWEE